MRLLLPKGDHSLNNSDACTPIVTLPESASRFPIFQPPDHSSFSFQSETDARSLLSVLVQSLGSRMCAISHGTYRRRFGGYRSWHVRLVLQIWLQVHLQGALYTLFHFGRSPSHRNFLLGFSESVVPFLAESMVASQHI
jgi:hypothetical protein